MFEESLILMFFVLLPPSILTFKSKNTDIPEPSLGENVNLDYTLLLPVRNEINNIEKKIIELISLFDYDAKKIIVFDSNSEDGTAEKATEVFEKLKPELEWEVIKSEIIGKSKSINEVIEIIQTPWFIMFDADASIDEEGVKYLLKWMKDPSCGAVCGSQGNLSRDISYRRRFIQIRIAESFSESSTILEGSFCAIRIQALNGMKLDGNINADDTQFGLIVKRNGFNAIFESRALFNDTELPNFFSRLKRNIRRSQGLIRVFWSNKDLVNFNTKFGISMLNSIYFYIFFPWLFIISLFLFLISFVSLQPNFFLSNAYIFIFPFFIMFMLRSSLLTFFNGLFSLILAQLYLLFGINLYSWKPDR